MTRGIQPWLLLTALAVWVLATLGHGWGQEASGALFEWAAEKGNLHPDGGAAGKRIAELMLTAVFLAIAAVVIGRVVWTLRRVERSRLADCVVPWLLWGCLVYLVWKCCVIYATELIHFAQYALIGWLLCLAIHNGRRPQAAFLVTTALGVLDEIWQHYGLALWLKSNVNHGLDWSDLILNALGTCGGVLVVVTRARAAGEELTETTRLLYRSIVTLGIALLPLLLLDEITWSKLFGFYWYHPFWREFDNHKAVHWFNPGEGIPICIAAFLVLGLVVEPRRHTRTLGVLTALVVLSILAIDPPTRRGGQPVHLPVPHTKIVKVENGSVIIDGRLDEAVWQQAERLGPFLVARTARSEIVLADGTTIPLLDTHARMLWDDRALYIAFEVVDDDIWGRETVRDDPRLPGDDVVEVFIDVGGDEINYFEIELSPLNTVYDLYCFVPFPPMDFNPFSLPRAIAAWNAPQLETAVSIDGEVDVVDWAGEIGTLGGDRGWTAEIAIPWESLLTTTIPESDFTIGDLPPRLGERWRIGLYRCEWRRAAAPGAPPYIHQDTREGAHEEWHPRAQLQAWSPTYNMSFHQPGRFGSVEFVERP